MNNRIGKRGESIFATMITRKSTAGNYLFDPTFLGDKFPTVDFYVSLLDFPLKAFFFASIKTTTLGYMAEGEKLKIMVDKRDVSELATFNLPVYIFGIDEVAERGFIWPASELDTTLNMNGISTKYSVTATNLERLYGEVADYWENSHKSTKFTSSFK